VSAEASRDSLGALPVGLGATFLAVGLMAWDHLWGNQRDSDDSFPVDAGTFFLSLGLIVATAVLIFGVTVPRSIRNADSIHRAAVIHGVIAVVLAIPASWLGLPVVVAGGAIALGVRALDGSHRRIAITAIALGVLVIMFGVLSTAFPPVDND
jgi:uncharacterized membrane protein YidH (DUF202 family)